MSSYDKQLYFFPSCFSSQEIYNLGKNITRLNIHPSIKTSIRRSLNANHYLSLSVRLLGSHPSSMNRLQFSFEIFFFTFVILSLEALFIFTKYLINLFLWRNYLNSLEPPNLFVTSVLNKFA